MQFVALVNSYAFVVQTKRGVAAGDQLFVDYGEEHFQDTPGGCPCSLCQVSGGTLSLSTSPKSSKRKHQPRDEETALNRKAKKLKNRKNREKGKVLG